MIDTKSNLYFKLLFLLGGFMNIKKFVKKKDGMYSLELEDDSKTLVHEDLILKYDLLLR